MNFYPILKIWALEGETPMALRGPKKSKKIFFYLDFSSIGMCLGMSELASNLVLHLNLALFPQFLAFLVMEVRIRNIDRIESYPEIYSRSN